LGDTTRSSGAAAGRPLNALAWVCALGAFDDALSGAIELHATKRKNEVTTNTERKGIHGVAISSRKNF